VAVCANDDQIYAVISRRGQDDVGDRESLATTPARRRRGHRAVRDIVRYISAGLPRRADGLSLPKSTTKSGHGRGRDEEGSASATARRAYRLAFPADQYLLPIDSDFQPLGMTRMGEPLERRSFSGDGVAIQLFAAHVYRLPRDRNEAS